MLSMKQFHARFQTGFQLGLVHLISFEFPTLLLKWSRQILLVLLATKFYVRGVITCRKWQPKSHKNELHNFARDNLSLVYQGL